MPGCARWSLPIALVFVSLGSAWGQNLHLFDPPKIYKPKTPPSRQEIDRRDALKKYVYGLLCEREDRLIEALKAYEESSQLDPDAAPPFRAQVPLLLALDRGLDALAACQKVVALDPDDHETWAILSRIHKARGHDAEARAALENGLKGATIKEHPEAAQQLWFDLGALLEAANEYGKAADAFAKSAELLDHPDVLLELGNFSKDAILNRAGEVHERIGGLYRKAKKYDQAVAAYVKAQQRSAVRAGRLNFNLAQVCEELGDQKKALAYLDAYLRTQPLGMEGYEMKIGLLEKTKQSGAIVPWLEDAAKVDMHNVGLHLLLARECAKAKQSDRAEKLYRTVADTQPSAEVFRGLFRLYRDDPARGLPHVLDTVNRAIDRASKPDAKTGDANQAKAMIGALRDDGAIAKELVQAAFKRPDDDSLKFETLHLLAVLADTHRKLDEAERFYRKCLPLATPGNEALIYGGLLRVLNKAHKERDIIAVCDKGLKEAKATNRLLFFTDKARALAGLKRFDDALKEADLALKFAGDDNKLLIRSLRVRLLVLAARHDDAENDCLHMLKLYILPGELQEVRYLLSNVYSAKKDLVKSEEQLHLILKTDPTNATANNDLGYLWADQGKNLPQAEEMIRRALEEDRRQRKLTRVLATDPDVDNAAYVDSLGWVLFRRGQVDAARKELERAAKLPDGDDPVIYEHLGDVYYRLRMTGPARQAWERAVQLFDEGARRKDDDRYRDLQRKLKDARDQAGTK